MEKFRAIRNLYSKYLAEFAVIGSQYPVLAAVLKFNDPTSLEKIIPYLKELGVYKQEVNQRFDQHQPVYGIRMGIGDPDLLTYELIFKKLNDCFMPKLKIVTNRTA